MDTKQTPSRSTMTVRELAEELGICVPNAYELVHRQDFPAISLGRRIIVPRVAFENWLAQKAQQSM